MPKKINKKVSINKIDKVIKANQKNDDVITYEINEDDAIEIKVSPTLSFMNRCQLVNDIADMCFVDDEYKPYLFEFAYAYELLFYFTNINCNTTADKLWALCQSTDIIEQIEKAVGNSIKDVYGEAKKLMNYRKEKILEKSKFEDLAKAADEIIGRFDALAEKYKDVDIEDVFKSAKALGNADEKERTAAVLDFEEAKKKANSEE